MADGKRSFTQKLILAFASTERAAAIEAESRSWIARCGHCAAERSIWDLGGIRYKAAGNPRMRMRCISCGKAGWHEIHRRNEIA